MGRVGRGVRWSRPGFLGRCWQHGGVTSGPAAEPADRLPLTSPLVGAVVSALVAFASWRFFVATRRGQQLDQVALIGSNIGAWRLDSQFQRLLEGVSVPTVAVMIAVVVAIAALRGRWLVGAVAALVIAGSNVTTQLLKYGVFTRDDLLGTRGAVANTLPSGHATVAAAGALGLLLVVPPVLRALTAVWGALTVTAFGYATLVNQWHRPSDVIAAVAVCLAWAMLGVLAIRIEQRRALTPEVLHRPGAASVLLVTAAIVALGLAAAGAAVVWGAAPTSADRTEQFVAYAAGVAAVTGVTFAGLGALLRLLDASRPSSSRPGRT